MDTPFNVDAIPGFGPDNSSIGPFYTKVVEECPPNSLLIEIGCFHGRSLVHLGLCAKAANKGIRVLGFDHCLGQSGGTEGIVQGWIEKAGLTENTFFACLDTVEASKSVADQSAWMVFLDDGHLHEEVERGILTWMPKVRYDGILAGHDAIWSSVWEPVKALLPSVIHDPAYRDCWWSRWNLPTVNANIHQQIRIEGKTGDAHFGYGMDGFRNDGRVSGSPLTEKV